MNDWPNKRTRPKMSVEPEYKKFYSFQQERYIRVASIEGQVQLYLSQVLPWPDSPEEHLLLCRFASTINGYYGESEIRRLKQLRKHLDNSRFEEKHGHADPTVAREVEREIIQRLSPDYAVGYDLSPAMRLLAEQEHNGVAFTQPERNLLLRMAFATGDNRWVEETARQFREKTCSRSKLVGLCRKLEQMELSWADLDTMDGLNYISTWGPSFRVDMRECENPAYQYPPFALYPHVRLSPWDRVLWNGAYLRKTQEGWWRSGIRNVDQTFNAPHFYKQNGLYYQIADAEHQHLFSQQRQSSSIEYSTGSEPEKIETMTMGGF